MYPPGCMGSIPAADIKSLYTSGWKWYKIEEKVCKENGRGTEHMIKVNGNFGLLQGSYLFSEIARRVDAYKAENPDKEIIRLGIGDVTRPLAKAVVSALHAAADEMGEAGGFHGYGPEQGYDFLRACIRQNDYAARGVEIAEDEIFVSDGSKCDTGNIVDILGQDCVIAVTDPVYPVYVDTNVMAGRSGAFLPEVGRYANIRYLVTDESNGFVPELPGDDVDVVYLCYPNNPTGMTLNREQLKVWVDWALEKKALLLFDGAYERFITEADVPHSIYEIEGAKECAIEFRSFSKTAGFTGTRCAYAVVPKALKGLDAAGESYSLNALWNRRQTTKFNGVSYIVQRAAAAIYTPEGRAEIEETIAYYLSNAKRILRGLADIGITAYGGVNSPYIWLKTPGGMDSWAFFDKLLAEANIVGTPGAGFGAAGEGYFRLTAFNTAENTQKAIDRLRALSL